MPKMPAEIAKAIKQVAESVEGLIADQDNKFANYRFVSHDQIKAKAGKLMAKFGLIIVADEVSCEVREKSLHCEYAFWIYHETGAEYGPIKRTVQVSASGAQAYGSAASYAQKYFIRDLFQIPTGEQDADNDQKHPLPESPVVKAEASEGLMLAMEESLEKCKTLMELEAWRDDNVKEKQKLILTDQVKITKRFKEIQAHVKLMEANNG